MSFEYVTIGNIADDVLKAELKTKVLEELKVRTEVTIEAREKPGSAAQKDYYLALETRSKGKRRVGIDADLLELLQTEDHREHYPSVDWEALDKLYEKFLAADAPEVDAADKPRLEAEANLALKQYFAKLTQPSLDAMPVKKAAGSVDAFVVAPFSHTDLITAVNDHLNDKFKQENSPEGASISDVAQNDEGVGEFYTIKTRAGNIASYKSIEKNGYDSKFKMVGLVTPELVARVVLLLVEVAPTSNVLVFQSTNKQYLKYCAEAAIDSNKLPICNINGPAPITHNEIINMLSPEHKAKLTTLLKTPGMQVDIERYNATIEAKNATSSENMPRPSLGMR